MYYSKNALEIYKRLYFDEKQNETLPEQVHKRVANHIGQKETERNSFFLMLEESRFRPNSPCLINAGRKSDKPHDKQLCACFVLDLKDSMNSIIDMWGICAKIYASGAGAGIPITNLREYKSPISSGGTASGPLRYLKVVDLLSETVRSGGRTRRAANIGIFNHNHPETIDILKSKSNGDGNLTSFNLSMSVNDKFMKSINDEDKEFDIVSPSHDKITGRMKVKDLWNEVINNAWTCGDPGLLFIDKVNKFNPLPSMGDIESTNPCGEVPLLPWSVCNIGSINLNSFICETPGFADADFKPFIRWEELKKTVFLAVNFLDRVIDATTYLHPNFDKMSKATRPLGLGFMGFADILIKLGIQYGSVASISLFEELCFFINRNAIEASILLCKGIKREPIDIPDKDKTHFRNLLKYYVKDDEHIMKAYDRYGIRNSNWTCIAPTGSISLSCDASYAWEPLMAIVWEKPLVDSDKVLKIIHPEFDKQMDKIANQQGITRDKIIQDIINNNGSIQNIEYIPQSYKDLFKVAHDIDPIQKIKMQGAGQRWISLAISSTCNLPNSATKEDIDKIFKHAYDSDLKGITIFRDGCLENQVVNFGKIKTDKVINMKERPIKRAGETVEIKTPYGNCFVTCNFNSTNPFEIFFRVGKQGALTNVLIDALGRVCSKALQAGIPMEIIVDTLRGLKGEKFWFKIADEVERTESAESIVDAIAQLIDYHWSKTDIPIKHVEDHSNYSECPQCHRKTLRYDTGCRGGMCTVCGHSACG